MRRGMNPNLTRRSLLKIGLAGGAALFVPWRLAPAIARAQIAGGTLAPGEIDKYVTPLLIPPVMPRAGSIASRGGKPIDYYEISMRQFAQQILPSDLPATTVWGYGAVSSASKRGLLLHNAPSLTIEAKMEPPGSRQVDQPSWWMQAATTFRICCRSTRPCTGPTRRAASAAATGGRRSRRHPGRIPVRSRSSPTFTARSASATRATATPKRGTCRTRPTSRPATRRRARGTTSSRARQRRGSAPTGDRASRRSSTRTTSVRRRSGTTTTRWA